MFGSASEICRVSNVTRLKVLNRCDQRIIFFKFLLLLHMNFSLSILTYSIVSLFGLRTTAHVNIFFTHVLTELWVVLLVCRILGNTQGHNMVEVWFILRISQFRFLHYTTRPPSFSQLKV